MLTSQAKLSQNALRIYIHPSIYQNTINPLKTSLDTYVQGYTLVTLTAREDVLYG